MLSVICGGMGVNISHYALARAVSLSGGLGTVSGVAANVIMARTLQQGDPRGDFRRALARFPFPEAAESVLREYFVDGGIPANRPFKAVPMFTLNPSRKLIDLTVCANFAIVWLAKEGHEGKVSINWIEKMAFPHIYSAAGAVMAGVDYVTMGAGIALGIPKVLDDIAAGGTAEYHIPVIGRTTDTVAFNASCHFGKRLKDLRRPAFLPIISSDALAKIFTRRASGRIDGFVVELPTAGGHNAPPRGELELNSEGEPVYGERDRVDFGKILSLGLPFWIGGSKASPDALLEAQQLGAQGIQAGSIFALCEESGLRPDLRQAVRRLGYRGKLKVRTDLRVSPTGFPFKVAVLPETLSDAALIAAREHRCNIGALASPYICPDGGIGYRCAAEPPDRFIEKGGDGADNDGACCLCNGLMATAGLGDPTEPPIVTLGDDVSFLRELMRHENDRYSAQDAMDYLLGN